MATVYIETTIPSYLAALPSRDLIIAAHQQITHDWWRDARNHFDVYISEAVLDEIRAGDPEAIGRRMHFVNGLPVLKLTDDVRHLVHEHDKRLGLTGRARADLTHFPFAVAYEYGLSGNMELLTYCSSGLWSVSACASSKIWAQDIVLATCGRKNGHLMPARAWRSRPD